MANSLDEKEKSRRSDRQYQAHLLLDFDAVHLPDELALPVDMPVGVFEMPKEQIAAQTLGAEGPGSLACPVGGEHMPGKTLAYDSFNG